MKASTPILLLFSLLVIVAISGSMWFSRQLELDNFEATKNTTELISNSLVRILKHIPTNERENKLTAALSSLAESKNILALAVCENDKISIKTLLFPENIYCQSVSPSGEYYAESHILIKGDLGFVNSPDEYDLVILFDRGKFLELSSLTIKELSGFFLLIITIAGLTTLILTRIAKDSALKSVASLIRNRGKSSFVKKEIDKSFIPIMKEVRTLVRELESDKKLRESSEIVWDSKSLKEVLVSRLAGDQVLVVANRQPYIHNKIGEQINVQTPASGLVTALEPVMRACSGIWFAHGNGTADREVVDEEDKVWVPPSTKEYQIKRIWLTEEQEKGFYYGFANEGLWPLCHIAHIRPIFRLSDFEKYKEVNQKFADAVIASAHRPDPIILVQDYHFALLPRMIRKELPKATIITFWHIPWPNAEKFGITPWVEELLDGMLGSSVLGFHTKYHCYNFLQTVDRYLESRINWERSTVSYNGEMTAVRQYPISIEFPPKALGEVESVEKCRSKILNIHKLAKDTVIGIGVERLDYTKGIVERFMAIERFFELNPEWVGKFTFIQIAAPSRSTIPSYMQLTAEVREIVEAINNRFSNSKSPPIVLINEHRNSVEIMEYFRAAKICMVMSLHDGMNLVAKEFIASREDNRGVLLLSLFAGAAKEFPQAFLVNPYDIEGVSESILSALQISDAEEKGRMKSMREHVREHNVFSWAGNMLLDAVKIRERNNLLEKISEFSHRPGYWQ